MTNRVVWYYCIINGYVEQDYRVCLSAHNIEEAIKWFHRERPDLDEPAVTLTAEFISFAHEDGNIVLVVDRL